MAFILILMYALSLHPVQGHNLLCTHTLQKRFSIGIAWQTRLHTAFGHNKYMSLQLDACGIHPP